MVATQLLELRNKSVAQTKVFAPTLSAASGATGARSDRPGLAAAVAYRRAGDMLTVTRLDRLGRTTVDTLKTMRDLDARGARVTARYLDTATPAGKLVGSVLASLA